MMFRSASRRARNAVERAGRDPCCIRSKKTPLGPVNKALFGTKHNNYDGKFLSSSTETDHQHLTHHPIPLPAVAYDYDDDYDDGDYDGSGNSSSFDVQPLSQADVNSMISSEHHHRAFSRGGKSFSENYLLIESVSGGHTGMGHHPTSSSRSQGTTTPGSGDPRGPPRKMARGGGGGRHRCPKCGTTVTFRCDFEDNTFYCASCSGWFVANPGTIIATDGKEKAADGSVYQEFIARNSHGTQRKPDDAKILMRHVRFFHNNNNNKVVTTFHY